MATDLLRPELLSGRTVAVVGAAQAREFAGAIAPALRDLGAGVADLAGYGAHDDGALTDAVTEAHEHLGRLDAIVIDAAGLAEAVDSDAPLGSLRGGADGAWIAARAAATAAMIEQPEGGLILIVAPRPGAGPHAHAARTAMENMARELSVEWSRYQIRIVTVTPGRETTPAAVASLVSFLVSPAGDYYSGCRLSLGEAGDAPPTPG